jgi:cytochrome c-type biogenesis protein CcmH/NrfG
MDLMRRDMGTLVALSPRGVAAEKLALPALQDGEVDRAERWVRLALRSNASDIVNGDALLTLARIRIAQGRVSEAHKVLEQARRVHPHCPGWTAVEAAVG